MGKTSKTSLDLFIKASLVKLAFNSALGGTCIN